MPCLIVKIIGTVIDAVAVHIVMLMGFIAVVVVVFTGGAVSVAAGAVCSAGVGPDCLWKSKHDGGTDQSWYDPFQLSRLLFVSPDGMGVVEMIPPYVLQLMAKSFALKFFREVSIDIDIKCTIAVGQRYSPHRMRE